MTRFEPLIINAALTGMVPRRRTVPHVPLTAEEIVADARRCVEAGASVLHLHARGPDEEPAWERDAYRRFIPEIRRQCPGVVICVTTSGRGGIPLEHRADVLDLDGEARPDMASLTLGSLNFRREASVNAPETILALARRMRERGIRPELEIFDSGMAHLAQDLLARDELAAPLYANVILGGPNTAPATARSLVHLTDGLPPGTVWAAGGFGAFQLVANGLATFMGGHVRTGLEDNPWMDDSRTVDATNEALVHRVAEMARLAGRTVATPEWTRRRLGLAPAAGGSS